MRSFISKLTTIEFYIKLPQMIMVRLTRIYHKAFLFRFASKETVFTSIWRTNYWGDKESLSGGGSTLRYTENIRGKLPNLIHEYSIINIFDAPCGDMNWMKDVLKNVDVAYTGGDIVTEIVENNKRNYARNNINFIKFDITKDSFPIADIWICRATLYHFSNRDICLALKRFIDSDIKYILTTNCITDDIHVNKDIATGDWRSLNLMLEPFNFPKDPLCSIDDHIEPYPPTQLCLWSREQISDVFPKLQRKYLR